jgi:hypothetical protein
MDANDEMLIEVSYRPPGGHTRFKAKVSVVRPLQARLSEPGYRTPREYIGLPQPHWSERKEQGSSVEVILEEGQHGDLMGALVLKGFDRSAVLRVDIFDLADGKKCLSVQRAVTAVGK